MDFSFYNKLISKVKSYAKTLQKRPYAVGRKAVHSSAEAKKRMALRQTLHEKPK